ncbi:hypothetical protein ACFQ7A_04020 [Streptomyces sp. NPDC056528]|uniref:hypothetical protein n=1 Tax=Streptomyces sp. NPDC056528 TaxID=3345854 RepID=UPI0036BAED04
MLRSWGDVLVRPVIGILLWVPFGVGVVWYPRKDHLATLTTHELRVRRRRLPMDRINLLHVARLWLEDRSTADDRPVRGWPRSDRVVRVPLHDGRAYGVGFRAPAAFARPFGDFAVTTCGGPEAVRAAITAYPGPRPVRFRSTDSDSWADLLDLFD